MGELDTDTIGLFVTLAGLAAVFVAAKLQRAGRRAANALAVTLGSSSIELLTPKERRRLSRIGPRGGNAMVRDPWVFAVTLVAFGMIGWVLIAERSQKVPVRQETFHSLSADPDLRLISERSPYMRTER
jgi:hypothetical protein